MKKISKVFIATSTFTENPKNYFKNKDLKKYKFIKNPIKKKLTSNQLIKYAKDCEFIIAGTEVYNKETIKKLKKLKYLFRMGSGVDNIDLDYLRVKQIKFSKSKITPEIAVAELIIGYILSFYRDISEHDKNLKNKIWKKKMGFVLNKKTVGIIGYGKIGRHLHKILKNFGVRTIINDRKKINKKNSTLNYLLKNSDIISINIDLSMNKALLNKEKLNLCKKNCIIINTARSEAVDNKYLFKMLKNKKILGACLDVFDQEPYYGEFSQLNNVILTPHIGSYSKEIRSAMEIEALKSIKYF